jgi:hypothetical protein
MVGTSNKSVPEMVIDYGRYNELVNGAPINQLTGTILNYQPEGNYQRTLKLTELWKITIFSR